MEITLNLLFRLVAVLYVFGFAGIGIIILYFKNEVRILQEAIALTIASDPNLAKKVNDGIKANKALIKSKEGIEV